MCRALNTRGNTCMKFPPPPSLPSSQLIEARTNKIKLDIHQELLFYQIGRRRKMIVYISAVYRYTIYTYRTVY